MFPGGNGRAATGPEVEGRPRCETGIDRRKIICMFHPDADDRRREGRGACDGAGGDYIKYYYWYYRFTFPSFRHPQVPLLSFWLLYHVCPIRVGSPWPGTSAAIFRKVTKRQRKKKKWSFQRVLRPLSRRLSTGVAQFYSKKNQMFTLTF